MDCNKEINEIKSIITSAILMDAVKREVSNVLKSKSIVSSGELTDNPDYDIVIKHKAGLEETEQITRRLKSSLKLTNIDKIVDNIIGIKCQKKS